MQDRPEIKIQKDNFMKACQIAAILCVLLCWGLALYYYNVLPERIAIHFDSSGVANGYGGKASIFLLPVIASFLVVGINWLANYPHIFNYAQKVTDTNAEKLYRHSIKILYIVNAIVGFILLICVITTLSAVFNTDGRTEQWSLPVILGLSGLLTAYSIIAAVKSARIK